MSKQTDSDSKKNTLLILCIVALTIVMALTLLIPDSAPKLTDGSDHTTTTNTMKKAPATRSNTIAKAWQWDSTATNGNPSSTPIETPPDQTSEHPFTQASVYEALQAVKLDQNGDVVLDDDALIALNAALENNMPMLDDDALAELQSIIKSGLPGKAGEQTAQIVADYYQYLGARNEFNALYETTNAGEQDIETYEAQYNELLALRELYLGSEAANKLFAATDANSQYMFDSMKLENNTSLSEEEKLQEQAKISERHANDSSKVSNWNHRYRTFSDEKQFILDSSVSEGEKHAQITELMHKHFSAEELESVQHLDLDSLNEK
jgi:lipase chaperone LimK